MSDKILSDNALAELQETCSKDWDIDTDAAAKIVYTAQAARSALWKTKRWLEEQGHDDEQAPHSIYSVVCKALGVAALLLFAGCFSGWETPAKLSPDGPVGWEMDVEIASDAWNDALGARGCARVFSVEDGGHAVTLVDADDWSFGEALGVTATGGFDWNALGFVDAQIWIRADADTDRALLHELGHALGMQHRGSGVMSSTGADMITSEDVDYAVQTLGCGP